MTTLTFEHTRISDIAQPLTLEEIFKLYAAYSGILETSFNALYEMSSVSATGNVTGDWGATFLEDEFPANFTTYYHKEVFNQGVAFRINNTDYYAVTTETAFEVYQNGDLVFSEPVATPEIADVAVTFRQQNLSENELDGWLSISVYMNNAHIASWANYLGSVITPIYLGFCNYDGVTTEYSDVRVPELCDVAEYGTLDPGELPTGGLGRTIEGRYLRWFVRYDGSLKAKKIKPVSNVHTFSDTYVFSENADIAALATHVRMMGAYIWAEAYNDELGDLGHRFKEVNNPMLLTKADCLAEAEKTLKRFEENAYTAKTEAHLVPMLEPEDRITVDGREWLINEIDWTAGMGSIDTAYGLRKYVWGEP